ncbi:two-component sensor histidine kinase [Oceanobacillus oncorhynchi subsp. incaldanensis]|uniref:histidine kinase n=2 Tax=Oceanobacillus TaxID=182709 RepID=A0A0A1MJJ2_9BACI|nr:HAMP domain-containing sensor histidine kinase [Oceanobacillus oncorhynchi]MDM8101778.1 HAMP domain-containing sensor histidine kinase [Oceanobacillus oncorhynchi]UUI41754.1 HAMP domain-containing histidine kinase [Oceanobacillus oncorhynchi]GIO20594.1 two-component sensor histidine kinase [Oceanobacillus oncorhynchi subsp. incaldanensis]CEI83253.1 Alkaline phosphatase synthesis sensor protein PhoR [Oceanobacillus oncorhynchi]
MSSWLIIVILSILLVVCISMLLLLYWDIRRITSQLKGINENFGTNELIRTNTHSRGLLRFIENINQLIHLFKQDQQRKQRREEALKQEITNLSHDLRTPLTSIKGFSELMADPSLSDAEKKDFLAIIQKKIDHLTMMVDQFYELSQIESSDQKFSIQQVSLNQLVVDTMLLFYHDFEKNKLQIEIDETAVPPILADEKAVHRIISNIVQNALRYAESYFTIRLAEEEECVRLEAENDITVLDDKTELHRIFDRSYRMDSSRAGGQLGLGLHIVRQLVMKLGGQIDAKLEDNKFQLVVLFKKWS